MTYCYRAYGVGIVSDTKLAGLEPATPGSTKFTLKFASGPEPEWSNHARSLPGRILSQLPADQRNADPAFVLTEHGNGNFYDLSYSNSARFVLDKAGERMWGATRPPLVAEDLSMYFLGPVMGFFLRYHQVICLHASCVKIQDRAVVFCGDAGFGKSTTAAALALRGAPAFSEDIVPLEFADNRYWVLPGYPRICLWPDAVEKLLGDPHALPLLSPTWEKRYLALDGVRAGFANEQKPIGMIYLFGTRSEDADAPRIEEIRPKEALLGLVQNTYMNWLLDRDRRAEEFDVLWKVVQQVPVRRVIAHNQSEKLPALCDRIFEDAEKHLKQ